MKTKRFLLVFTLLSLMCNIYADNLSVSDIKILAGKTGSISISLNNTSSKYTAFQFDLILPDGVTIAKDNDGKYLANLNEERIDDQKLTISDMGDNTYRFLTFSMKNSDFSGTEGELVNVTLQASSTIGVGTKKSTIEGAVFTRSDGTDTYFDEATFNLIVVSLEITPPIAKGELVYNGKAQELIEAGQTTFGKLLYSLNDKDYGSSIPTGTDAKKYMVYYKAVDDNEIDLTDPSSLDVTIAAKTVSSPTIILSEKSYVYDGNAKTPSVTVKDGETEIPSKEYTVGYKDNVEVGTATVTITDNEGGNYTVSGTATFAINAADGSVVAPTAKEGLVYNGKPQDLITAGSSTTGTMKYSLDGKAYDTAIPQGTDAKDYTVYYMVEGDANHNDIAAKSLTATIAAKTVNSPTIVLSKTSYTYDGNAKEPTVTVKDGETVIPSSEYTVGYSNNVNVGTATVTITDKEGGNYTVSGSASFAISAADGSLTPPTAKSGLVYTGAAQDLITAGSSTTGTIQYSLDGTAYGTAIPQGTDAKEYTVYYKVVAKAGYNDVAPASLKVTISAKTVSSPTIVLSPTSYVYDGNAKTPSVTVKDGETVIPSTEYTVGYSNNVNVGTATVTITDNEGGNYTVSGTASFTIEPDNEPVSITVSQYGKTTFCCDKNLDFSGLEEVKAYAATGYEYHGESSTIWMTRVKDVPAGTPIVVKGAASTTYPIPVKANSAAYYKNLLVRGAGVSINATDGAGHRNYVMSGGKFVAVGETPSAAIGTNKCYLQLPETMNAVVTGSAQSLTLSATGTGKTTYCAPVDLDFTDVAGLIAYSATGYDNSTGTIWLTRVKKVSAGEGLLLKGTKGGSYTIPSVGLQSYYANMIVGNNGTSTISINPTDGDFTNYVLSGGKFVALSGSANIPVGKAYLQIPSVVLTRAADAVIPEFYDLSEEPEVISMVVSTRGIGGDNNTTGIKEVNSGGVNSQEWYNLNGQRVEKPGKGLYIHNGKKVVIN